MRDDHTAAEKAQIGLGAGFSGILAVRLLLYFSNSQAVDLLAVGAGLIAAGIFCYGVGQLAVSRGHSAAWGFAGFFGYLIVSYVLKPKRPAVWQLSPEFPHPSQATPPPPPPPGFVPTRPA